MRQVKVQAGIGSQKGGVREVRLYWLGEAIACISTFSKMLLKMTKTKEENDQPEKVGLSECPCIRVFI
mgnify:CR=1 FL=1